MTLIGLATAGYMVDIGWPFYAIGILGGALHLSWQIFTLQINNTVDCWTKFKSNQWFGLLILLAIMFGKAVIPFEEQQTNKMDDSSKKTLV
jgi:4-hydroxybenzoate polyprenyltransferase